MRRTIALTALLAFPACASSPEPPPPAAPPAAPAPSPPAPSPAPAVPLPAVEATHVPPEAPPPPPAAPPPIPKGTVVLHIGDSFALAGFAQALKARMKALGVRYEVRAETSSFTTSFRRAVGITPSDYRRALT